MIAPRRAITLVEMVIAMLIVGIMAAAAVPTYQRSLWKFRAEMAARRIAVDLAATQARARSTSRAHRVVFLSPPDAYRYEIREAASNNLIETIDLRKDPYCAVTISAGLSGPMIANYDGFGQPVSSGAASSAVDVQAGQYRKRITLDLYTGATTINDVP